VFTGKNDWSQMSELFQTLAQILVKKGLSLIG